MERFLMVTGLAALVGSLFIMPAFAEVSSTAAPAVAIEAKQTAQGAAKTQSNALVVADFDTGEKPNNIGGDFGSWDKDPNDETQGCKMSFESEDALGNPSGYAVRFDYDVDSSNPAYNGFWMKLNNLNATEYNTLNFDLKGDAKKGFTKRVKIELKDASGSSPYIVTGVTDQWQQFSIPFEKFKKIKDWTGLTEFVVVFDDINSNPKTGSIYLDHVTLSRE